MLFARADGIPSLEEIEAETQTGLGKVLSYIYDGKRDVTAPVELAIKEGGPKSLELIRLQLPEVEADRPN